MPRRKLPAYALHFAILFVVAPVATYFIFKPAENQAELASRLRTQHHMQAREKKHDSEQSTKAIVSLILDQKDQTKNRQVDELLKKGQR